MNKQVLVLEGNEKNREMLKDILSDDYIVIEAENYQNALDILKTDSENISLIIIDLTISAMDGYSFLDVLKNDDNYSSIPVIVTTSSDNITDEITALEHGANDFVQKPFRPQVIRHRAASLIKLRENAAMVNQFKVDSLTGLYTKEYFYKKVREILDKYPEKDFTLTCSNIESFKLYNDTHGRQAGDQLLKEAAELFRKSVPEDALCCRYSADRFLCLMEKTSEIDSRVQFEKSRKVNRSELSNNLPVKLGVYEITDRSLPVEIMCDRVMLMVDSIKGIYDQYVAVYDDTIREKLHREQAIVDSMETALAEKQFVVYFQPKNSLDDDSMTGAEALVRWIHPEWGFMSPGEFIPLFEKNGFICRLDEYVWESVCEKLREWKDKGYELVPVSVNVSRIDIYHSHIVDTFCGLIEKYGIEPSLLHLEITESAFTKNTEQIISTVDELQKKGFVIEMDDFGSGYSSLSMLSQMSLDVLKLDMIFIRNETSKPVDQSLLRDIINMAHRLRLKVVAEGVETLHQKERLKIMNCNYAQGYYYAKPMAASDFEKMLEKNNSDSPE